MTSAPPVAQQNTRELKRQPFSPEARERARRAAATVGLVLVRNDGDTDAPRPRGSAVVVRKDGLAATNFHVIARDRSDVVYDEIYFDLGVPEGAAQTAGRRYRVLPVLIDRRHDLALVRVVIDGPGQTQPPTFSAIELADSRAVQLLDDLIIIGFPEKGGPTVTVNLGVVEGKDSANEWIKTDGRLIHGNSGGAAVNADGKLVGIPTKVVVDADSARLYGAVGYLRPANLVAELVAQLDTARSPNEGPVTLSEPPRPAPPKPATGGAGVPEPSPRQLIKVKGIVRSTAGGKPIAGARIGLVPAGSQSVTSDNLLTWGGSDPEGHFELNRPIPPGRYAIRARAIGFELYSVDLEITDKTAEIVIQLSPS
jgi:S1-C subfamily serine protease